MRKAFNLLAVSTAAFIAVGSTPSCSGDVREILPFWKDEGPGEAVPYGGRTTPGDVTYAGGDGTSVEKAVVVLGASGEFEGVDSEYIWLETKFGPEDVNWHSLGQDLLHEHGRYYDKLTVEFLTDVGGYSKGEIAEFYFDITDFYGKF